MALLFKNDLTLNTVAPPPLIGAVIMAAGAGRRMGHYPKSLLQREGEPLLLRQARLLRQAGIAHTVVVLGHHAERLMPVLQQARALPAANHAWTRPPPLEEGWDRSQIERGADGSGRWLPSLPSPTGGRGKTAPETHPPGLYWTVNPTPDAGPGSSLRRGLSALPPDLAAVMVMLGDQPLLEAEDVAAVLAAWRARAAHIDLVLPEHEGQPGHPLVFGPAMREAVLRQTGGAGVRDWRRAHPNRVQALPSAHARYTTDIDTPPDIERLHKQTGVALTGLADLC